MKNEIKENPAVLSQNEYKNRVLKDFRIISLSRICSVLGRREVLTGKGKFGIFGDGKEVACMPKAPRLHFGSAKQLAVLPGLGRPPSIFSSNYPNDCVVGVNLCLMMG